MAELLEGGVVSGRVGHKTRGLGQPNDGARATVPTFSMLARTWVSRAARR